ncbi:MAG: exodeoxyribonuclease V subunit gamma [Deltaproteobacteria bacterium]|nr:exodeoxyribonuclease V subunit gamma [Deltaproteobacteria bacterium]
MKIVLGPYHPQLEDALAEEIRARREHDPLAPLLLVVPSETLRRRVKILLAKERGLHLLNFHVLTFFQLSLNLFHEMHGPAGPVLRDETFMEEALRRVVPARGRFARIMENDGACSSLWQSLRDLKDAMVDPETALEALREGLFGNRNRNMLGDLLELYGEVRRRFPQWRAQDHQDLDATVARHAPVSAYLGQFERICYYGFYDLTQSQLELFRGIAGSYPVTLFFPLARDHPDWSFAQDFYDRYLRGRAGTDEVVDLFTGADPGSVSVARAPNPPADRSPCHEIVSCAGPRDEVLTVAKTVLRLVEEEGIDFQHVGVVSRVLDSYLPWIREIFPEHGIPFHTPAGEPLGRFNRTRAVLTLLDLPVRDYPRAAVIDLLASHDFNFTGVLGRSVEPRPELWDVATRALRITRGMAEWRRLEGYLDRGLRLSLMDDEEGRPLVVPPEQIALLLETVNALHEHLSGLPAEGKWSDLAVLWRTVVDRLLEPGPDETAAGVTKAIDEAFDGLAALEDITPTAPLGTFTEALRKSLDQTSVRPAREVFPGVRIMDAGAARGVPFRALFLMGMNEGVFPRTIREDPFLRDHARTVLERDLGYKVSPKLAGYGEEKLLFALLTGAVTDRLHCSYQRSDAADRPLAPSWYLRELGAEAGRQGPGAETAISKSVLGKRSLPPFDEDRWLLPEELAVRRALLGEDPAPLVRLSEASLESFEKSTAAVRALDDGAGGAGPFDGVTGPLEDVWRGFLEGGVSPTALEAYGLCPFQYFARGVLQLQRLERPEAVAPVQALEWGQLCHEILERFYQNAERAWGDDWSTWLDTIAAEVLSDFEERFPTGYPAAWEVAKDELVGMLQDAVRADRDEMTRSGFRPVDFESTLTARLDTNWPEGLRNLPVRGRLDRIDHNEEAGRYRIIDYKYKSGRSPQPEDRNPLLAAIRGQKLQLPVYTLLAADYVNARGGPMTDAAVEAAWYYFLAGRWEKGPLVRRGFSEETWGEAAGQRVRDAVARLLRGIRAGEFFIMPGSYCRYCEVSEICRKDHFPSVLRAGRHPAAEALTAMRKSTNGSRN